MAFKKMTGGRFLAETLKGYGVDHVFFMPAILRRTLVDLEELGIKRVLVHSEKAAAYMADGYARVSRRPGVCMAQSVGAANLAAGLQDAYLGLSPVIAITGKKSPADQYRNAYQEVSHRPFFAAVTKLDADVDTVEQLPMLLRQAFRTAVSGAPGPVHLDLIEHRGAVTETEELYAEPVVEKRFRSYPPFRPLPENRDVDMAVERIRNAAKPVIVAGGGASASGAGTEITGLAELLSIPVATSLNAKGLIPENHPLSIGVVGTYSRWCANRVVAEADLVLFIGSHTGDQVTNEWKVPAQDTPVIQIDIDPVELGRNYPNTVSLCGDAAVTIKLIKEKLEGQLKKEAWARYAGELAAAWREEFEEACTSGDQPIRPERLCREITQNLPENGILVADTGFSGIWAGALMELRHPGQKFIRAAGSLGWAFPASLGAKCAAPDRPVICFTGDGGFWYHMSELETAVRCGIKTVTIINNNNSLSQVVGGVQWGYQDRQGNREEVYCFNNTDFSSLTRSIGGLGIRVDSPGQISDAIQTALASDRPAVVEVITDGTVRAPSPWKPQI